MLKSSSAILSLGLLWCALIGTVQELRAQKTEVPNVIQPVQLNIDTTILKLNDFFVSPEKIDSVTFQHSYNGFWNRAQTTVTIIALPSLPPLAELMLWSGGKGYAVLLKKSQKETYRFTFNPRDSVYKTVQLAGEMNDWNPKKNAFKKAGQLWQADVVLNPGSYQYQLVIDGKWRLDPGNPDSADNNNGGFNSVFRTSNNLQPKPVLSTEQINSNSFSFSIKNKAAELYVYWQNFPVKLNARQNEKQTVSIPEEAKNYPRSFIRVFAANESGIGNDLLIPLENGKVLNSWKEIKRTDKEAYIIYSILVDRFYDGDLNNDKKVVFAQLKPQANYYGGDLAGVLKKINAGYFDSLHVNTLWISPIVQNPETAYQEFPEPHNWYSGYHGYWPISITTIDYRFGNDAVLTDLVKTAHKRNENVLLDLVANHVHEECPWIKQHPEWTTQLNLPDGRKNIRLWDEYRLTTWFDTFLPTLDFTNNQVIKLEVDSSVRWVSKFDIDGFRHDATKHINTDFWRSLTLNLKRLEIERNKTLYQIGETYGSKELIGSYIGSGLLDGQFDFNLYFTARNAFAKDSEGFEKTAATLKESIDFYGSHHLMGNITGNHDQPRVASLAGGALSFSDDPRKVAWEKEIGVGNDVGYNKLAELVAFIATIPGIPVIYYGDEIGMPGAGDPDNRRMMKFGNLLPQESALKEKVTKLFQLRSEHLALIYGDFTMLKVNKNVMAYQRKYFDETVIVIFNNAPTRQEIFVDEAAYKQSDLEASFGNSFSVKDKILRTSLAPKSFEIFIAKAT